MKIKNAIGIATSATPKKCRPTSSFRSIGRQHPTQMTKFLTRPDEGKFFSLTYKQEQGLGFLDRQAQTEAEKANELGKDGLSKAERLT